MRSLLRFSSAIALALVAFGAHPAAQALTSTEVQRAVEHPQPEDHARLRAHFLALSARHAADANRHKAFARSAAGVPRGAAAAHHERLASLASESARVTAELAMHHQALAAGLASTAPWGGEAFEAGAGAPAVPSEQRLMELEARASTPSEHGQLREYYLILARQSEARTKDLRSMARMYRGLSRSNEPAAAQCDRLAGLAARAAAEARAMAREHQ